MPIKDEPTIICPVDDTGKNSVSPSIMARIIACKIDIENNGVVVSIPVQEILLKFHVAVIVRLAILLACAE